MRRHSRSWRRWRRASRLSFVTDIKGILTRRLDPGWNRGEPSALLPDWSERLGALTLVSAEVANASEAFVAALAGAPDAAAVQAVRNAALSREQGAFTE